MLTICAVVKVTGLYILFLFHHPKTINYNKLISNVFELTNTYIWDCGYLECRRLPAL